jgi:hypothetical protein
MLSRVGAEAAEHDALDRPRLSERREHGAKRNARGAARWKAVSASRDCGIGNRGKAVLARETEARTVTGGKQLVFAALAAAPNRTNGVDDVTREKAKAGGHFGIASLAAAEFGARRAELGTCGAVDCAIHAASAKQRPVGGVDDDIDVEPCDVAFDDLDAAAHGCIADASKHEINISNAHCAEGASDGAPDVAAEGADDGAADADGVAPPPADDGLTDLIQAITFHTLSESLSTPPIGGIGPTTFSLPLRV